jgi:RimJ/RimL family protein N-acetyltransferase
MEIHLSKSILRPWRESDIPALTKYANNLLIAQNLRDIFPYPYTSYDAEFFISQIANSDNRQLTFAIELNGEAVGSIGAHLMNDVYRKNAEIGYWLGQPYWNRGIITEALQALVTHIFNNYDICRLFANVFYTNTASIKVLEKCNFTKEATHRKAVIKNGKVMDELVYVRFRD